METFISTIVLFALGVQFAFGVEMTAKINMLGEDETVTFTRSGDDVTIAKSGAISAGYDIIELWSLPAVFGRSKTAAQVCSSGIGTKIRDLQNSSVSDTLTGVAESVYYHRTALYRSSTNLSLPPVCGTILPTSTVITYRAKFMGPVAGTVWLRYTSGVGTFVYGDLVSADITSPSNTSEKRDLKIFSAGSVGTGAFTDRCTGLSGSSAVVASGIDVYKSTLAEGTFGVFSPMSTFGNNLAVVNSNSVVACAVLRQVAAKTALSTMNWAEVQGTFKFTQASPFDLTLTTVNVQGLENRASGFHVHKYPVPQRLSSTENRCDAAYVSGHFNPYGVVVSDSPAAGTGTSDQYEIGDLSGKYGNLMNRNEVLDEVHNDYNLPLWGPNSIIGRSIVIHYSDGSRLMCGTIDYPTEVVTGISIFKSPAYGTMYMRQDENNPDEDTSVFVELARQDKTASASHNWHVHVSPVGDNAYTSTDRCQSAGPHYNPSIVSVSDASYGTECRLEDPLRCELGDLSGRLGTINLHSSLRAEAGKFFYTDEYLHLSGPFSVLGRSMVVHGPSKAAARFACANITQLHPVVAKTETAWVGTAGSASGTVRFEQKTEFDLTKVTGSFSDLASLASGYHIHEYTISTSATSGLECEASSVAGHYNPFNWTASTSIPNDTYDRYEVGDLSMKYDLLDGQTSLTITDSDSETVMDTNLPLFTFLSASDKSIVIHKKEGGARWKCANVYSEAPSGANGYTISANVTFSSVVSGTIKMRQVIYEDGGAGLTSFEVDVSPKSGGSNSNQHNWHIHIEPVTAENSCAAAAGHYDPYGAATIVPNYPAGCSQTNPLLCEVGDLSKKQAKYDIGGGRKAYHDVDVPLHTNYTVLGRSIVFHAANGGAPRYACANIVPDDYTYTLSFSSMTTFTRSSFTKTVADALGIAQLRVVILHNLDVPVVRGSCAKVMVHIAGGVSIPSAKLEQLVAGTLPGLGEYASKSPCTSEKGATVVAQQSGAPRLHGGRNWVVILVFMVTGLLVKYF